MIPSNTLPTPKPSIIAMVMVQDAHKLSANHCVYHGLDDTGQYYCFVLSFDLLNVWCCGDILNINLSQALRGKEYKRTKDSWNQPSRFEEIVWLTQTDLDWTHVRK